MMNRTAPTLPPEVFESVVTALADTLIRDYRERWNHRGPESSTVPTPLTAATAPTWLKISDAAKRAQCGEATIRREVRGGRLRAVKVGGRRSMRFRAEWIDEWLQGGTRQK
jgi:excisionase family DNA binding protein